MNTAFYFRLLEQYAWLSWLAIACFWIITAFLNLCFAAAVARDAGDLRRRDMGPHFVGPMVWAFATLLGGIFVLAIYWLMHHSILNPPLASKRAFSENYVD